jgi:carbon-monoxide dehydrogenase medium subunit
MILPPLQYLRPRSVPEAVDLLSHVDGATVLAGGQTLINMLKLDLVAPAALVDVHRLDELRHIELDADGTLVIGAATTYREIAVSSLVRRHQPAVATMAGGLVDRQVRNRGTIGGNCCLNDPANNFPPLLTALHARFRSIGGPIAIRSAEDFFTGTLATALAPNELLTAVEIPALPAGTIVEHAHQQLAADSWAIARAVVRIDVSGGVVTDARVVLGAVLGSPLRLGPVERALVGRRVDATLLQAAGEVGGLWIDTVDDMHCSAGYRREMAHVQLRRALRAAVERNTDVDR